MSAADIDIFTIIVPNPLYNNSQNAAVVNYTFSYHNELSAGFQTLSSNNPTSDSTIEGLLYVPTLFKPSGCVNVSSFTLPANTTTETSFPPNHSYPLFALFPWGSVPCVEAFLATARADAVKGAIVFQENSQPPPPPSDNSWSLQDGGRWKTDNQFPIYAIQSTVASQLVHELSLYSGNMTEAPFASQLGIHFNTTDFPRLYARADLEGGNTVPSLWIFLIIVLAVLLGIVIAASIIMHLIQRRQRFVLQRRLQRGEVDLEALGIKRMNVPQEKIDEMPKYVYTSAAAAAAAAAATATDASTTKGTLSPDQPQSDTNANQDIQFSATSQPTCPICLDDFVSGETTVRELPCNHIFHPECIDLFLRDNSSLCPMCKKSALPAGYIPVKVTNFMVRRERLVRRMRERRGHSLEVGGRPARRRQPRPTSQSSALTQVRPSSFIERLKHTLRIGSGLPSTPAPVSPILERPEADEPHHGDVEMVSVPPAVANVSDPTPRRLNRRDTVAIPEEVMQQGVEARRAWRRERMARAQQRTYEEQAETARAADEGRPLWRRMASRFVPGFD